MHTLGKFSGAGRNDEGDLTIIFTVENEKSIEQLREFGDKELVIDASIYRHPRSDRANRYLWKLLDLMAERLHTDKDSLYLLQLSKYGVFEDWEIPKKSVPLFQKIYKYIEVLHEGMSGNTVAVRCYIGSHYYDSKQMGRLIDGTIMDAEEIGGIDTASPREVQAMIAAIEEYERGKK